MNRSSSPSNKARGATSEMVMCDVIDKFLSRNFESLGRSIGRNPGYYVIIPILIAIIFATGLQRIHYEDDPEYLFSPRDGRSKEEKRVIDTLFPMNYSENFNVGRITHKGRFGRIIVAAEDGGDVLRPHVFEEIVLLDALIQNITIEYDDLSYRYSDLCAKNNGKCAPNNILDFADKVADLEDKKFNIRYPLWINREAMKAYFFPANLGGVTKDPNSFIESAKAVSLLYFLDITIKRGDERAAIWENKFNTYIEQLKFNHISVARFISTTLRTELEANTQSLVPFFSVTVIIMIVFSVGTCMMADWVRSKPWLGLLGCISAGLGVAASFGICAYVNVDMIGINLAAPFLMLGVGMDDAFVLLAAWRRTDSRLPVPERLGQTYAEAAVSISITSVTNFISFLIGTYTPFPSVRIFCIYTAVAVLATYVYHITFFGGCMAFFGDAESKNLHGLTCVPVMPRSVAQKSGKSFWFILLCTGGRNAQDPDNPIDNREHSAMIFFRDVLASALNKAYVKVAVILIFLTYLSFGIYGCTLVKEGLDRRKLSRDDSYSVKFYDYDDRFFREYPYRIQLIINQTLNYADPEVQDKVERILSRFESSPYIASNPTLTESWLRQYLAFIKSDESFLFLQSLNVSNQDDFHTGLRSVFLHFPLVDSFKSDIVWNEDFSEIKASRFIIQTTNIRDANMEKEMLISLRSIADEFIDDNVTIFNHLFIFFDQFILVREISLQTISIAALVMMVISLFFIPSASCAFWVAFSIISIEIGVIGYMTHWGVNLDSISMINLIMCIGFSVDFSAHISYAYISCEAKTPAERVRQSLYSLGLPIFQGSVSTILGIVALAFAPSYVFLTFFKTVFLVMLFGATHGVLLLPVLLSLTDSLFCSSSSSSSSVKHVTSQSDESSDESTDGKKKQQTRHKKGSGHHWPSPNEHLVVNHDIFQLTNGGPASGAGARGRKGRNVSSTYNHGGHDNGAFTYVSNRHSPHDPVYSFHSHSYLSPMQMPRVETKFTTSAAHVIQPPLPSKFILSSSKVPMDQYSTFHANSSFKSPTHNSSNAGEQESVHPRGKEPSAIFIPRASLDASAVLPFSSSSSNHSSPSLSGKFNKCYSKNWTEATDDSGQGSKSSASSSSGGETDVKDIGFATSEVSSEGSAKLPCDEANDSNHLTYHRSVQPEEAVDNEEKIKNTIAQKKDKRVDEAATSSASSSSSHHHQHHPHNQINPASESSNIWWQRNKLK